MDSRGNVIGRALVSTALAAFALALSKALRNTAVLLNACGQRCEFHHVIRIPAEFCHADLAAGVENLCLGFNHIVASRVSNAHAESGDSRKRGAVDYRPEDIDHSYYAARTLVETIRREEPSIGFWLG